MAPKCARPGRGGKVQEAAALRPNVSAPKLQRVLVPHLGGVSPLRLLPGLAATPSADSMTTWSLLTKKKKVRQLTLHFLELGSTGAPKDFLSFPQICLVPLRRRPTQSTTSTPQPPPPAMEDKAGL